LNCYNTVN